MDNKKILSIIVILLIIVLAVVYVYNHKESLRLLKSISLGYMIILMLLVFITILIQGIKIKYVTKFFNIKLNFREWFGLSSITILGDYLTPFRGGVSARAIYLKKKHHLPYTSFVTTIGATYIINFFLYALIGIFLSLSLIKNTIALVISLIAFFIIASAIFYSPTLKETRYKKINYMIKVINGWESLRKDYKLVTMLFLLELANLFVLSARFYFSFKAISSIITFNASLIYSLITVLSAIFAITPAALGIREGLIATASKMLGTGFGIGAYAASIDRAAAIIVVFIMGFMFTYLLSKRENYIN